MSKEFGTACAAPVYTTQLGSTRELQGLHSEAFVCTWQVAHWGQRLFIKYIGPAQPLLNRHYSDTGQDGRKRHCDWLFSNTSLLSYTTHSYWRSARRFPNIQPHTNKPR